LRLEGMPDEEDSKLARGSESWLDEASEASSRESRGGANALCAIRGRMMDGAVACPVLEYCEL
jgi:hypothetical protein